MLHSSTPKLAFSIAETCEALGLGKTTIYGLIASGRLDTLRIGGRRLVTAASIHSLLAGGNIATGGEFK
jgi:excisionase family DNA binding protein